MKSKNRTKRKIYGAVMQALVRIASVAVCLLVIFMTGYVLIKGIPNISWELISSSPSYLSDRVGILPDILNTLYIILASLVIILPLGVGAAIYLNEYAANKKVVALIEYAAETLSGIPSIIYGLFGMLFFVTAIKWGYSILAGSFTLAIMVLPTIIRSTEEALLAVDDSYREGSFGLGAGKLRTVFVIVLPSAASGILSGIILSIGRIVGETAALIYTAGTVAKIPESVLDSARTMSIHMYSLSREGLHMGEASATAVILLVTVLLLNTIAEMIARRFAARQGA